jgi:protein disulfide-isomerase A6
METEQAIQVANQLKEMGAIVVNGNTYSEAVMDGPCIVVGYAPWCGHCHALLPELRFVIRMMNNRNASKKGAAKPWRVVAFNADADENGQLSSKLNVKFFPSVYFILNNNGQETQYNGIRKAQPIWDAFSRGLAGK